MTWQGKDERDSLLSDAVSVIREFERASASLLERWLGVDYARAARMVDQLEALGYIAPFDGSNDRLVLLTDDLVPEPLDPEFVSEHETLTQARNRLGLSTPSLYDIDPAEMDDLRDFECTSCGRLASVYTAAIAVLDTAWAAFGDDMWYTLEGLADSSDLRPAVMQKRYGLTFERASELLGTATDLGLIRRVRNSWTLSPAKCALCLSEVHVRPEPTRPERESVPAQLRFRVFQRDGFRCVYCGQSATDGAVLHVDHVVPVAAGGLTTEDNLMTACATCNLGKSATPVLPDEQR